MSKNETDFSALIGSRICHDLISPIGAINNGLELLHMGNAVGGPEMQLIEDSADHATARIKLYRIAFGDASDHQIGRSETVTILNDYFKGSKIDVKWGLLDAQPRDHVRLALLSVLCFETALPHGGTIRIDLAADRWNVHCDTPTTGPNDDVWRWLSSRKAESLPKLKASHVQFGLLPQLAIDCDRIVLVLRDATSTTITF